VSIFFLEPDLSPDDVLRALEETFPLEAQERSTEDLVYFDTFDWLLSRAGLTLAAAPAEDGVRLTLLTGDGQILKARAREVPHFAADLPKGAFREALESASHVRRLLPKARASWQGELFAVLNEDEKTVVRIFVLEGEASAPSNGRSAPLPPRIRLLPLKGYEAELNQLRAFLTESFPLRPEGRGEFSVVLRALGQHPQDRPPPRRLEIRPDMSAADAAREIHLDLLGTMLVNREGMIKDWDPEFLHDFRVALRRSRSILTQLKGVFPETEVQYYRDEFRWLGGVTGPTRDLDVYLLKIPVYRESLTEDARKELEPLVEFLRKKKRVEHRRLVEALRSQRFTSLMGRWQTFLVTPTPDGEAPPNAWRPIREVASERIWQAYEKVLKKGKTAGKGASPEALHRLRIDCKKLRYLLTLFSALYPEEAVKPVIKELKRLQDHLGDFNDLHVQRDAIRDSAEEMMATETGPPPTLLAMGQLMGQLETRQVMEQDAFRRRFKRFARRTRDTAFRDLFGPKPDPAPEPEKGKTSS
jgi:CHAD domain-containing protein